MDYINLLPLILIGLCDFDKDTYYNIEHNANLVKSELDKLTKLLCEAGKVFKGKKPSKELLAWWNNHEKLDRKKKQ